MGAGRSIRDRLARLGSGSDDALGLAEPALLLACLDCSGGDPQIHLTALDALAAEAKAGAGKDQTAKGRAKALAELLGGWHGFSPGDDGDDDDANLMTVLQSRRGGPEALGIVWLEVARRAGWAAEGLAFPSHLLVRLEDSAGRRVIVDPGAGGLALDAHDLRDLLKAGSGLAAELTPALYAPLSNRDILVRLQNDLKLRVLRNGQVARALVAVEGLLLLAPDRAALWREAGMMHMRLDNLPAAVAALEQYVARAGDDPARRRAQLLLQQIRARLQ